LPTYKNVPTLFFARILAETQVLFEGSLLVLGLLLDQFHITDSCLNAVCFSGEAADTNSIAFYLARPGIKPLSHRV
jgi:hypothetical protein